MNYNIDDKLTLDKLLEILSRSERILIAPISTELIPKPETISYCNKPVNYSSYRFFHDPKSLYNPGGPLEGLEVTKKKPSEYTYSPDFVRENNEAQIALETALEEALSEINPGMTDNNNNEQETYCGFKKGFLIGKSF